MPANGLSFNEMVYADPFDVMDAAGERHWMLCLIDGATNYCTVVYLDSHDAEQLFAAVEAGWLTVAKKARRGAHRRDQGDH